MPSYFHPRWLFEFALKSVFDILNFKKCSREIERVLSVCVSSLL